MLNARMHARKNVGMTCPVSSRHLMICGSEGKETNTSQNSYLSSYSSYYFYEIMSSPFVPPRCRGPCTHNVQDDDDDTYTNAPQWFVLRGLRWVDFRGCRLPAWID